MAKKIIVAVITLVLVAGVAKRIYNSFSGGSVNFDLNPYHALGSGAAEETAKLIGNKGPVVIIAPDTSQFKNPAVESELSSCQKSLAKSGLKVAAVARFKMTPMESMATGGAMPRDQFLNVLQSHPSAGAVVLFCGFPQFAPQDYDVLKQGNTKFIVASGYLPAYRKLLEAQVIHLAIVPKFDRSASPAKEPKTPREWFEQDFVVITPGNTATLPY